MASLSGLLTFVLLLVSAGAAPAVYPSDGGLAAKLQPFVDNHVIGGCVVLVADKEKILDLETVGYSDLDAKTPMQPNDLFWIASMTKSFTAAALMMMVDEEKLDINDPVEKYLPEFKGQMVMDENDKGHAHPPQHPITVREIMSHTSALTEKPKEDHILKDDVMEIAKAPLEWEPGTKFRYNNSGINVGGYLVEVLSGMPYGQFIQQRILDPLEMKDTTYWPTEEQASHLVKSVTVDAATHKLKNVTGDPGLMKNVKAHGGVPAMMLSQFGGELIPEYANHYAWPAGGLFSTATDVSKFCRMLLNGGTYKGRQYLTPASLKQMTTDETGSVFVNPDSAYGLGYFVLKKKGDDGMSVGSFGHLGARKTVMEIDPENGLVLIMMLQNMDLSGQQLKDLYSKAFFKTAITKYGRAERVPGQ
jgi:CubicO group peptidase (beta-lactamase class C family)